MLNHLLFNLTKTISKQSFHRFQRHLHVERDKYNAIHIKFSRYLPAIDFENYMNEVIQNSQNTQITSIWVHLHQPQFKHATYLTSMQGFNIHHGIGKSLSLYKWMLKDRKDLVVPYSMFHIGCGGVLIENNKILLVQEKRGDSKGRFGLPGGRADHGQGIKQCSERQLFQELGIRATFKKILWMRQLSSSVYDAFDMYYACLMGREDQKQSITICDYQIQRAQWVDLTNYRQFADKNSFGTQRQLAHYLCDLFEKGYDFNKASQNYKEQIYTSPIDGKNRFFAQHKFLKKQTSNQ